MSRRKESSQKAAMRELMRDYLKNNDIRVIGQNVLMKTPPKPCK